MGDMTDYYLSQEDPFDPLGTYWESPEPEGEHPPSPRSSSVAIGCRYCLAGPFQWAETAHGFRLVNERGEIHSCAEYDLRRG